MNHLRLKWFFINSCKFNDQTFKKIVNVIVTANIKIKKKYYMFNKPIVNFGKILKNVYVSRLIMDRQIISCPFYKISLMYIIFIYQ